MLDNLVRYLFPLAVCVMMGTEMPRTEAKELLVFISAFAPGDEGAIHAYQLEPNVGQLKLVQRTPGVEHPFFLAVSPDNKFLYSIHAPGQFGGDAHEQIAAYEILGRTGELKLLNHQSTRGSSACYLDVDATGKTVVVANYSTGSVASLPVRKDGSLGEITSFVQHAGSSVNAARQAGPHTHCAVISPDNRFVYAADLGLDKVLSYRLDPEAATLVPSPQPFVRTLPGAGPRHLTFHPNGRHMYVINELANSLTLIDCDAQSGILIERQTISTLPKEFSGTSYCADVKITPDGRFLYGTNRGHDSIAMYRIGDDGQLTLLKNEPSLGEAPQNLAITPGGELLLCANMTGNNVVVFRIDAQTGGLTPVGQPISLPSPACIMVL
ncbi:MAG: lactonase family protein [Pirellulaceae bacterium]